MNSYGAVRSEQRGYQENKILDSCFREINLAIKTGVDSRRLLENVEYASGLTG